MGGLTREDEVTNKEESLPNDLAKERIIAYEDVAPKTGVESKGESSCGDGNGKAKWDDHTFDLNEPPRDEIEDANEIENN
ncbi:unnamed protein product [Trifolium pratense]|uniref:Uncharacterized protein n=1 Tax=Trifolium pratense TaxID=57577 RepID=A0ACB0IV43_TRIPR|nr:unnamed protein product [Trifolium pratense]